MALGTVTATLLESFKRLTDLLDEPEAIEVLAPLVQREIHYRLLTRSIRVAHSLSLVRYARGWIALSVSGRTTCNRLCELCRRTICSSECREELRKLLDREVARSAVQQSFAGDQYLFNLSLSGFAQGTYALTFTAAGHPTGHTVRFQVK